MTETDYVKPADTLEGTLEMEDGETFVLSKGDVEANIKFPISWNQRQCLCCFKDTKNYESYNNIIQKVMVAAIRLLQELNDEEKILNAMLCPPELEDQTDVEAGEAIWTIYELERLLVFISNSLVMSFPLYIVCKHNHICGVEELSNQETSILASYCDVTDAESLSVMLLRNVCFFCDSGGPQAIKKCFEEYYRRLTIPLLGHIVHCLSNLKHWLTMAAVDTYIFPLKPCLVRYMMSLSDDNLRQAGNRNITEMAMSLIKEPIPIKALFDREYLKLSFKYFSCSTLKIRMAGLQQLNSQIALFNEALSVQDGEQLTAAGLLLAEWLVTNRIIEHIFGPNLHNELVKQSQLVLNFLGIEGKITVEHIGLMWAAAMQKHCSRQVLDVLILLVKHLTSSPLVHLMDLLAGLDPQCMTEQTVLLAHTITKKFWFMYSQEEKNGTKCSNADASLENEISVCSTDDEESEETSESDGEVEMPVRPKRSLPMDIIAPNAKLGRGVESNPVQIVYNLPDIATKHYPSDGSQRTWQAQHFQFKSLILFGLISEWPCKDKDCTCHLLQDSSSPTCSGQHHLTTDSDALPAKHAVVNPDDHMNISSDNDGASIITHLTLPVTVADLENLTAGGSKRIHTPPSSPDGSIKSVKNMGDFDGEEFMSDEELVRIDESTRARIGPHSPRSPPISPRWLRSKSVSFHEELNISVTDQLLAAAKYLDVPRITEKGHTILWDLIQEDVAPLLAEGLAHETEKLLNLLLCSYDLSASIKLEFIQACITNIQTYRSSTVSLRLLTKIISSFQPPYRAARELHSTTMYIEESFSMMTVFFSNLIQFRENLNTKEHYSATLYGMKADISVRLQFLSFIYSYVASPPHFCMSKEQVDIIWQCLAMDKDTSDYILSWFYTQANSREFHAITMDTFNYIYNEKLTQLSQKDMTMTGFNLFHLLHEMLSDTNVNNAKGHDTQLWDIALKSQCTEVSLAAIDYLNSCYMSDNDLSREPEFVDRCMKCLLVALKTFTKDCETSMQIIDRGLYLLKNHMESFRQKYAYQLRLWHLKGGGVVSHQPQQEEKGTQLLKLILNAPIIKNIKAPANSYKVEVEVLSSVLLGELRADVSNWWHKLVKQQKHDAATSSAGGRGDASTSLKHNEPHVRLITNGQELTVDMDKKSLQNLQFRDNQTVLVSLSSNRQKMKQESAVQLHLVSHLIPMMILVEQPHFDNLLNMLEELSNAQQTLPKRTANRPVMCSRSRVLSRRVWDLLMVVPTNPSILQSITQLSDNKDQLLDWGQLLDPSHPAKLIYALQIVESLSKKEKRHKPNLTVITDTDQVVLRSEDSEQVDRDTELSWIRKFIVDGGLLHLFNILASRKLEEPESLPWNDWDQDAFAYLLKLLCQFSVVQLDGTAEGPSTSNQDSKRSPVPRSQRQHSQKIVIPNVNTFILEMIDSRFSEMFTILHTVIYDCVLPQKHPSPIWGRFEVLHQAMIFLVYWAYSDEKVHDALLHSSDPTFSAWLKRLTLVAPESQLRQEACKSLYNLCLGQRASPGTSSSPLYTVMTLSALLELLPIAVGMEPLMNEASDHADNPRKSKVGPSSQDYLWLTGQLLDSLVSDTAKQFDLDTLAETLRQSITDRSFYEQRHSAAEDEGLIGLLNLLSLVIKHNDHYRNSPSAKDLLSETFDYLFLLPCIKRRHLPKCKSNSARRSAYDLLVELVKGSSDNYRYLHAKLAAQHDQVSAIPWDYWPMEDVRSVSGYVGLQNLGATCYMATCMQHLYMIPEARESILQANCDEINPLYSETLAEMKKMFAYLMESERKSYNPQSFCKVYEMDRQPLNTGEQKDMTEFFTDLISKLEDMSPNLKSLVKGLFGGVISNNVVSLDCPHVSRTLEEFYTIRCQVADMKNLYESLDEVCVKDTLDGDNMYTCSQCQKKVRAEKRACFKRLPKILCFNTMRYTFNMVTMLKEKINTHFSFPLELNMADYMDSTLLQPDKLLCTSEEDDDAGETSMARDEGPVDKKDYMYHLTDVTVHTGTADGGHYYSFIRDRLGVEKGKPDKWFLFNDAEVKNFDPAQIAQECFGGEMTSTTYDTIAEKFMDFSFEKTNSAYMLFYERVEKGDAEPEAGEQSTAPDRPTTQVVPHKYSFELSEELANWIWKDNTTFLQDKSIFCHDYFGFMWQICAYIPTTLPKSDMSVRVLPAQLSTLFLLETFIHAKEKPTMVQWIELLTKLFNQCHDACEWLLDKMSTDDHWSKQILISCSNQMIRQMFQRLILHVVTQLRTRHYSTNKDQPWLVTPTTDSQDKPTLNVIARFICKQLQILELPDDIQLSNCKYLAEYFSFLYEFARLGTEEKRFLIDNGCITTMITFYIGNQARTKSDSSQSGGSSDEDEVLAIVEERFKVTSLDKMIHLVATLVESSRGEKNLELSARDLDLLVGDRGMRFLVNQIKDSINHRQTCNLIFSLSRYNEELAAAIIHTLLNNAVRSKNPLPSQTFLKVLTMTTEQSKSLPGQPEFADLILSNFWVVCEKRPQQFLEWMSNLVCHNYTAHCFMLQNMHLWVEKYLLAASHNKARTYAMLVLVSLVPNQVFRNYARAGPADRFNSAEHVKSQMTPGSLAVLHTIYMYLLELMPSAKKYAEVSKYSTSQLVSYLSYLALCLLSKEERLMFGPYFPHLWALFQPKMTDPQVSINMNKQTLLLFWHQACIDCPENVSLITGNPAVTKNIAFNYILADHDDHEVVGYNRCMLPAYYGILKLCCQRSRSFTRHLAQHQNMMWAFQHILPYPSQYAVAVDELLSILQMIVTVHPDSPEEEEMAISTFKKKILSMYQQTLNSRSDWQTLITVLKIVLVTNEDRFTWLLMSGLTSLSEAFGFIHGMYHEATACHVLTDICDCLTLIISLLNVAIERTEGDNHTETIASLDGTERTISLLNVLSSWEKTFLIKNCLTLLNSYSPSEVRVHCINVLKKLTQLVPENLIGQVAPLLLTQHANFQSPESPVTNNCVDGPYFPTRSKINATKINVRPSHPQFGMFLHHSMVETSKGQDSSYDHALHEFYMPYHIFVDFMVRVAVNKNCLTDDLINLSVIVAYEGAPLHSPYFAKLWCEIYEAQKSSKDTIQRLCQSSFLVDYFESILHDDRSCLNNQHIYQFFTYYFKLVNHMILCDESTTEGLSLTSSIAQSLHAVALIANIQTPSHTLHSVIHRAHADLRALLLIYQTFPPTEYDPYVVGTLTTLKTLCMEYKKRMHTQISEATASLVVVVGAAAAAADNIKPSENQKVPEYTPPAEPKEDGDQPPKKRRLSPRHSPLEGAEEKKGQVPNVTIEYRPTNPISKGLNRTGIDKGKGPAKKSLKPGAARGLVKSSKAQQAKPSILSSTSGDQASGSDSVLAGQSLPSDSSGAATSAAELRVSESGSSSSDGLNSDATAPSGNSEAISKARRKIEMVDTALDTIGAVLSIIENLEAEDDLS